MEQTVPWHGMAYRTDMDGEAGKKKKKFPEGLKSFLLGASGGAIIGLMIGIGIMGG